MQGPGAGGCPHKAGGGSRGLSRPQNVPPSLAWGAGWRGGLCAACREVPGGMDGELCVMEMLGAAGIDPPGSSQGCRHHTRLLAEKRAATARVSTCVQSSPHPHAACVFVGSPFPGVV